MENIFILPAWHYFNNSQPSKIYKLGTGLNGTVAGQNYGSIPEC